MPVELSLPNLHPEAQTEYEDHLLYYAANKFSLTTLEDFRAEVELAFQEIAKSPTSYRLQSKNGNHRRYGPTKIFRFVIHYTIANGKPYILALAHPKRKPD